MRSIEWKKRELYGYVGPAELLERAMGTARFLVIKAKDVARWERGQERGQERGEALVATFVVDGQGKLWIADRRSEHVACARGGQVQAAGELEFEISREVIRVVGATNQSTGFCPRVESWEALEVALDDVGLSHPMFWTAAFEFRRCERCSELNVVKDEWYVCSSCDADLPEEWNIGNAS